MCVSGEADEAVMVEVLAASRLRFGGGCNSGSKGIESKRGLLRSMDWLVAVDWVALCGGLVLLSRVWEAKRRAALASARVRARGEIY
jgi:hypothetical protein